MDIEEKLIKKLKNCKYKILLPEAARDKRIYNTAKKLIKNGYNVVVLGEIGDFDKSFNAKNCRIINRSSVNLKDMANKLYELRKDKGLTPQGAYKLLESDEYFACMLLRLGYADCMLAGAVYTTADTLKPALQIIKTKPNKKLVCGCMLMIGGGVSPYLFSDVALNVNPTAEELSEIAISSAEFYKRIIGKNPQVAMLSYSTLGSAKSEFTDKVSLATKLAKQKSNFNIVGEIQADAALNKTTAKNKGVGAPKKSNVLIFPDLNSGNIGYKLVSELAGYTALGPIMLNFNKPVNDLSRGCTEQEAYLTALITLLQVEE